MIRIVKYQARLVMENKIQAVVGMKRTTLDKHIMPKICPRKILVYQS
jgi:predicted DNA-binding transcriptional regulator AlpA